ncbi:hypothetical protein C0989_011515 [Termitomyces sp. Mn162]|nr:hypothetical protein C0989_011515 [Termitomyces sp. Mn162]
MVSVQYDQAQVLNSGLFELTLLQLEVELVLAEAFQDKVSDLMVLLQPFGIDEDVVKVHTHYALCYKVPEDVVNHGLEGSRAIGESKEHNKWLEQFPVGSEGSLLLISLMNAHIVVTPPDVQLSEVLHTLEVVDELRDKGERVTVLHHHNIEYLVVLDQLEGAILLFDEEDQKSHWRLGWADVTRVQVLLQECVKLVLFPEHKWELRLTYATKLPSALLLQSSTVAPIVLMEGLSTRKCQRWGIQEV